MTCSARMAALSPKVDAVSHLADDEVEPGLLLRGAVEPPSRPLVEPPCSRVVLEHPQDGLVEPVRAHAVERVPHQRLTDPAPPGFGPNVDREQLGELGIVAARTV